LNKLEKSKPRGPRVSVSQTNGAQATLTTFRQQPPLPCPCPWPRRRRFLTHRFPAATLPSSTASSGYKGRPPAPWSTLSSSSAFRPPLHGHSRRCRATVDSPLQPLSDRFDHTPSTAPLCTTSPHRELSTTTPGRRPHRRSPLADRTSP
jgi:hypothetical protein